MAKGQLRSTREKKKPKADKSKVSAPATVATFAQVTGKGKAGKKGR